MCRLLADVVMLDLIASPTRLASALLTGVISTHASRTRLAVSRLHHKKASTQ